MNNRCWLPLLALTTLALGGCGDLFGLGGGKEIEVYVVTNGGAGRQGSIEFDLRMILTSPDETEVPLTSGAARHAVRIEGGDSVLITRRRVGAVEYDWIRLVFTRVQADVEAGLQVGSPPVPVLGRIEVAIPQGGSVIAERLVNMNLPSRRREMVVIDLNAATWLPAVQLPARTIPPATFENAIRVRVR